MRKGQEQWKTRLNKDEEDFSKEIKRSFVKFEENNPISTPSKDWFEKMVIEEKGAASRKWRKELLLFSGIATLILVLFFTTLTQIPVVFITLQGLTVLLVICYTLLQIQKHREKVRHGEY
ncbi:YxlC family protein [Cytobacillus sp. Sa5YUA1]|uniref:YxlC family protein n=1 Tax=Cytobacillus stercorigallinarum TaxID=2762240 RepID=A0ABR8QPV9_9BACI|nr:YxlC family protein [Cytobacillus stercorigallinarum]MBD7937523.1 YxlC family protein [Cytobacillus stercorigallinarum]